MLQNGSAVDVICFSYCRVSFVRTSSRGAKSPMKRSQGGTPRPLLLIVPSSDTCTYTFSPASTSQRQRHHAYASGRSMVGSRKLPACWLDTL